MCSFSSLKAFVKSETEIVTFKGFVDILQRIKFDMIEASKRRIIKTEKRVSNRESYMIGEW